MGTFQYFRVPMRSCKFLKILAVSALLTQYSIISPELPALVLQEWGHRNRRAFWYALVALVIGGLMGISLIGGFIYLVMNGFSLNSVDRGSARVASAGTKKSANASCGSAGARWSSAAAAA
jgi:hypothetical protein